jgi:phosphonate transport system permease protein
VLSFPASWTFQRLAPAFGAPRSHGVSRLAAVGIVRGAAVLARAIPDVFWAMLLISLFRVGTLSALLAITIHTFGLLGRLFTESVDALPLRRLEPVYEAARSRAKTYAYAAVPGVAPHWIANTFFQLEANVRASIVLGMVGKTGLGFMFQSAFEFFRMHTAGVFLLAMVLWALVLDRLSRALGFARARLAG